MPRAFIDDGYNETGYIAEKPRLHEAIRFVYRPMTSTEYAQALSAVANEATDEEWRNQMAKHLAGHLQSWDVKGSKGTAVSITQANLLRFIDPVLTRLWKIVSCQDASDPRPGETAVPKVANPDADMGNSPAG